ncbi:MAG: hypothetical protein PHX83_14655 [Acidobacteriia bacterium]|nr:hypothetical protein [Terriglobia bacterium]
MVKHNQAGIARLAELLCLPPALVQVAVAHIGQRLGANPSSVIATVGLALDQLKARSACAGVDSGAAQQSALPRARKV